MTTRYQFPLTARGQEGASRATLDHTVLVVSRVREGVRAGLSPRRAVEEGIVRTAGVVTNAAVIMVAVVSIFGTLGLLELTQLGGRAWAAPRWLR